MTAAVMRAGVPSAVVWFLGDQPTWGKRIARLGVGAPGVRFSRFSAGWLDRTFSPLVTLWVFPGQVLSADHSCRAAVARLIAHRLARGQGPCSAATGAYC